MLAKYDCSAAEMTMHSPGGSMLAKYDCSMAEMAMPVGKIHTQIT